MNNLPLIRLLKIQAAIAYLGLIKKSRKLFLYFLSVAAALVLICLGIVLVCLSFLINLDTGVLPFGIALIVISAVLMGFLLNQRAWMRIFEVDQLIENIEKGGEK